MRRMDDSSNFQRNYSTGEVEVEGSVIYHKTEYRERRNHYAMFYANRPVQGPDMQQAPVAPDPTAFLNSEVPGSYAPEGDDNGNGGDYNG